MRVKLARGPMANKYMEIDDTRTWSDRLEISGPSENRNMYRQEDFDHFAPLEMRRGHYQRSNEVLKNGAVVYQWMGWRK